MDTSTQAQLERWTGYPMERGNTMRRRYYIDNPRNFANEFDVYAVEDVETERRLLERYPHARRITRRQAEKLWTQSLRPDSSGSFMVPEYIMALGPNREWAFTDLARGTKMHLNERDQDDAEIDTFFDALGGDTT